MNLKLYLVKHKIKTQDFADRLGCSRSHLSQVMNGKIKSGLTLAKLIESLTHGEVTVEQVIEEYKASR